MKKLQGISLSTIDEFYVYYGFLNIKLPRVKLSKYMVFLRTSVQWNDWYTNINYKRSVVTNIEEQCFLFSSQKLLFSMAENKVHVIFSCNFDLSYKK